MAVVMYLLGLLNNKTFSINDDRLGLIYTIMMDIQLLIGLFLYFKKGYFGSLMENAAEVMKSTPTRFFAVEHLLAMLIAVVLVHIGKGKVKKNAESGKKFRIGLIFYGIALLIILAMIPWPFRAEIARPWFPGMSL